jgi:hypothetical protein
LNIVTLFDDVLKENLRCLKKKLSVVSGLEIVPTKWGFEAMNGVLCAINFLKPVNDRLTNREILYPMFVKSDRGKQV